MTGLPDITALLAQRGGGNTQQWVHLIVVLLVISGSFLSWLFKQLQAKAEQKRRMDAAERRALEELRTGRPAGEAPHVPVPLPAGADPVAADRQRDLAARRQAQLQELRRRQLERARQNAGGARRTGAPPPPAEPTRQTPLVIIPGSTGPIVVERPPAAPSRAPREIPRPATRQEARQAPPELQRPLTRQTAREAPPELQRPLTRQTARDAPREAPRHPASVGASRQPVARPQPEKKRKGSRQRPEPAPSQSIDREKFTHISEAAPALQVSRVSDDRPVMANVPSTPEDWRRAIIAREILAGPLADRFGEPWQRSVI